MAKPKDVNRFEVIDEKGRVLVRYGASVELAYQDDGQTLKVFLAGGSKAADNDGRPMTAAMVAERAVAGLDKTYTLTYTSYDDQLTPEQVARIFEGPISDVEDAVDDNWHEYRGDQIRIAIRAALGGDAVLYEILRADDDEYEGVVEHVEERNDATPFEDLIRQTPKLLMRYDLNLWIESGYWDMNLDEREALVKKVAETAGLDLATNEATIRSILQESGEGQLYFFWYGEPREAIDAACGDEWRSDTFTITWENPSLLVLNTGAGSGYDEKVVGTITRPFDREAMKVDSVDGYWGWDKSAGLVKSAFACEVKIVKTVDGSALSS